MTDMKVISVFCIDCGRSKGDTLFCKIYRKGKNEKNIWNFSSKLALKKGIFLNTAIFFGV